MCGGKSPGLGSSLQQPQEANAMQNHSTGEKVGVEGRADVVAHEVMKKSWVLRIKGGLAGPGTDCEA